MNAESSNFDSGFELIQFILKSFILVIFLNAKIVEWLFLNTKLVVAFVFVGRGEKSCKLKKVFSFVSKFKNTRRAFNAVLTID